MRLTLTPSLIINGQSLATSVTIPISPTLNKDLFTVQVIFTGTPTGTLALQVSLDNVNFQTVPAYYNGVSGNSSSLAGAPGNVIIGFNKNILPIEGRFRLQYTATSGTGLANIWFSGSRLGS